MSLDGIQGSSTFTGPLKPKAGPAPSPVESTPSVSAPVATNDRMRLAGPGRQSEISLEDLGKLPKPQPFDVSEASERLIAAHGGNLEQAYFESINIRNAKQSEPGYAKKLGDYSQKLGYQRNLTADELRDVEHFMFAAASVAEQGKVGQDASYLERVGATLKREPYAVGMTAATLGYSAAKAINKLMPDELKFLKSRTNPSLDEIGAGLKGTLRGLRD